ncbi:MAG: ribonuclease III [Clostridia bacterium]|nr:ribonuclease III [Clostridia bacterium]
MDELEKTIGYKFKDRKLLKIALTHSSYANESGGRLHSYERLEFLGDSVLGLITSDYIFKNFPNLPEGELTKLRASLVCERQLFEFAKNLELHKYIKLSRGERHSGGENRPSILADVFEAICAAIYLDSGMEEVRKFVLSNIVPAIKHPKTVVMKDYKTHLQEIIQKNPEETIEYVLVGESGPDHDKRFTIEAKINNNVVGRGTGKSKKQAEQQAAKQTLELMGY